MTCLLCVFSVYTSASAQHPQSNHQPPAETQPQFAAYRHDVHPTGSPQHSYHARPSAAAAGAAEAGGNVMNMPAVQTVSSIAVPAQHLL